MADRPVLTEREQQIVQLLALGLPNKEIARRLFLSESTIKSHLSHMYAKLGVSSRVAAVTRSLELGIVDPPP
ncbi:MAG: response regulator transcription factor [Nocardioidaceae bacterium]